MISWKFKYIALYINYLRQTQSKAYTQSPFVQQLVEEVLLDDRWYYTFDDVEEIIRKQLVKNKTKIKVTDHGAGSRTHAQKERSIRQITKSASAPPKVGQLLFNLIRYFKPKQVVELGTSFGIGTLYQAKAAHNTQITTIEGCPEIAKIAQQNFDHLAAHNIQLKVGAFDQVLPTLLPKLPPLDFVFFDGNHQEKPTLQYFEWCLPHAHENSVFVFDDIYWSEGMQRAWLKIKQHPQVNTTIDLFRLGLVFFKKDQAKQDFKIYF